MKIYLSQINSKLRDIEFNRDKILSEYKNAQDKGCDLIIFSEMVLSGYYLKDSLLEESFLSEIEDIIDEIIDETKNKECAIMFGCPYFVRSKDKKKKIANSVLLIDNGEIKNISTKKNLSNYGFFEENRYFEAGKFLSYCEFRDMTFAIMIGDDLFDQRNQFLLSEQVFDLLISLNSRCYERENDLKIDDIIKKINKPFIYMNQVGGQDSLVFDGGSFFYDLLQDNKIQMKEFEEDYKIIDFQKDGQMKILEENKSELDNKINKDYQSLTLGLKDYLKQNNLKKAVIEISHDIDSILSLILLIDVLGSENIVTFTDKNDELIQELCKNMKVELKEISIQDQDILQINQDKLNHKIKNNILESFCEVNDYLFVYSKNKSDISLGLFDNFGDLNLMKDLYKSHIFELLILINEEKNYKISSKLLKKPDFIEILAENDLKYDILDKILYEIIENRNSIENLVKIGYNEDIVKKIVDLFKKSSLKRKKSTVGIKISKLSFDCDLRE